MSAFLRLKLTEAQLGRPTPQPFCGVNIMEAVHSPGEGTKLLQKKKTFYPDWNKCFDSHLVQGRRMQVIVMDRSDPQTRLGEMTVELEELSAICRDEPDPNANITLGLDLWPSGKLLLQVKLYGQTEDEPDRTPEHLSSLPKNATALRGRRGAMHMKQISVKEKKGHSFQQKFFRQPAYCTYCHELLWGFNKREYQCSVCAYAVHTKCVDSIIANCTGATVHGTLAAKYNARFKIDMPHRFKTHSYFRPTFCDHCGQLMHGILRQGQQCEVCKANCHHKCVPLMPNLCGVNERLMAEELKQMDKDKERKRMSTGDIPSKPSDMSSRAPPLPSIPDDQDIYQEVTEDMTKLSLQSSRPPVPPRPQSYVPSVNGGMQQPQLRSMKRYKLENFKFLKVLGKGSFGKVFLAQLNSSKTDQFFAIKALKKDFVLEEDDVESTFVEKRVMTLGNQHPFLTHVFCTFHSTSHLFFAMEYLNGGDLMFHIQVSHKFKVPRAKFYAAEIICALQYLHKHGIIYRDLKLDNVLLNSEGHAKLADFGMCKEGVFGSGKTTTFCGTPDYISPEIVKGQPYSHSVDFWSLGVLSYEMITGQSPFSGDDEEELFRSICNSRVPFPSHVTPSTSDYITRLLEKEPSNRLGCTEDTSPIRSHQFFASIDWDRLESGQIEPPFKPKVKSKGDVSNFDDDFTFQDAILTPCDNRLMMSIDQTHFKGFSYSNEGFLKQ